MSFLINGSQIRIDDTHSASDKIASADSHASNTSNPHAVTAAQAGASSSTHVHGNITNDGKVGSTSDLMLKTSTAGAVTTLAAGTTSQYLRGDGTWTAIDLSPYAPLASPALTGNPTAPTASVGDNDTTIATTAFVNAEIANDAVPKKTSGDWDSSPSVISNVIGLLSWKHYSNSHVIFDASNATSPSGSAVSVSEATYPWSGSMPCLMGWNGASTYGVKVDTATRLVNSTGTAPNYACRAWVNFNGTGTVAIRASGNVSSITDNGTGQYTVNFTTAMQDSNYTVSTCATSWNTADAGGAVFWIAGSGNGYGNAPTLMSSSQVRFVFGGSGGTLYDPNVCAITIFR